MDEVIAKIAIGGDMAKSRRRKRPSGRPPKSKRSSDGTGAKRYPYSIRATMRSIQEFGLEPPIGPARNPSRFVAETADILRELHTKYPGHHKGKPEELVERLMGGKQDLKYFGLRYFAECVRVPTSVLYAFTHLLGDIARDGERLNAINLLDSIIDGLQAAKAYVESATEGDLREAFQIVFQPDIPEPEYDAKLDCLREMSIAYAARRFPRTSGGCLIG